MINRIAICMVGFVALGCTSASAEEFRLMTGVDAGLFPGSSRPLPPVPGPGFPGTFFDGQRLAGTADVGPAVTFLGSGTPLFEPNAFGSLSFTFKRGSVPAGPQVVPLMGIDFLGGPLLDLDGDLDNGTRSLIPVFDVAAVPIPGSFSFVDLDFDLGAGTVSLAGLDATGTNEGGPGVPADIAVVVTTMAGTEPDGTQTGPINPAIDTRTGTVSAFPGLSNRLTGVYRIEDLGYEFWQDTLLDTSSTASTLGSLQYLGTLRGWLILRDGQTGLFPVLAGEGLGTTLWPLVDTSEVGNPYDTANGLAGGSATVSDGIPSDVYSAAGNGGVALSDFGGDLGGYLDAVVLPLAEPTASGLVYLESAGFGINNSNDPVFTDTVAYDVVLIAQSCAAPVPDLNDDGVVNAADLAALLGSWGPNETPCCPADLNQDGLVNAADLAALLGAWT